MHKLIVAGSHAPAGLNAVALATTIVLGSLSTPAMALVGSAAPVTAAPAVGVQMRDNPRIVDLGLANAAAVQRFTIALTVLNQAALDAAVAAVGDPTSASFRQFITPQQFAAAYGQPPETVAQVTSFLQAQGFTVDEVAANNLLISVRGTNAQIAAVFGTPIHNYSLDGANFQAPVGTVTIPAAIASVTSAVVGLSDRATAHSHAVVIPNAGALAGDVPTQSFALSPNVAPASGPGSYTALDAAAKYNVTPLYKRNYSGAGRTIGIITLAGYVQSDAYAYWQQIGLNVSQSRITDVLVAGGALTGDGPGTDGAGETTLDVEQSGALAPGANVMVYIAPNTTAGFVQAFSKPINDNLVDVLSISWGNPEVFYTAKQLKSFETLFQQAALQGIPIIAATGDSGAFDINRSYTYPQCTTQMTVDFPASSPNVLAAGGTTLPNTVQHKYGPVTVPTERAWGWDYLHDYITTNYGPTYGSALYYASYFTVGGGGGVSVDYNVPSWQKGLAGVQTSPPGQVLSCDPTYVGDPAGQYEVLLGLPAGIAGRNVPDVSLNADPYSGYSEYFTDNAGLGPWHTGSGGTSFVSPQLNGILTLISSGIPITAKNPHGRVGSLGQQLYAAFKSKGYAAGSPFKAISSGDNEYFKSTPTYNPASGLGSLDVTALAAALGATK